jgi:glycosyltransferase involved in cell wall biosynthesis
MTREMPAVTVLMTAYNRERYIAEAIESVLAQTVTDFELVIVDDRSTDGTVDVARRYLGDPRVRLAINERNIGDYPNRNHAATLARGEFFKYHDSDDVLYPHALQVMLTGLRAVPDAAFALSSSRGWPGGPSPMRLTPRLSYEREFLGSGLFHVGPSCALFRTARFPELGGFPLYGAGSDYVFWLRTCARVNIALVAGDLFWYRTHDTQEIRAHSAQAQYARASGEAWTALTSPDCPLDGETLRRAKRNWTWVVTRGAIRHLRAGRPGAARRSLAHSGIGVVDWIRYLRPPVRDPDAGTPVGSLGAPSTDGRERPSGASVLR